MSDVEQVDRYNGRECAKRISLSCIERKTGQIKAINQHAGDRECGERPGGFGHRCAKLRKLENHVYAALDRSRASCFPPIVLGDRYPERASANHHEAETPCLIRRLRQPATGAGVRPGEMGSGGRCGRRRMTSSREPQVGEDKGSPSFDSLTPIRRLRMSWDFGLFGWDVRSRHEVYPGADRMKRTQMTASPVRTG